MNIQTEFKTIEEFNNHASEYCRSMNLNKYFKTIHSKFYSSIDISFMDYFLELIKHKNEFIVEHIKLKEYGVINNIETTAVIIRTLKQFDLIENEDYQVYNVVQVRTKSTGENTGNVIKKEYKLTPYAFKLCLIRAKNSKKYANYYLMLEECFYYFQKYEIALKENEIKRLNNTNIELIDKMDKQTKQINEQTKKIDKQSEQINELLNYSKEIKEQNEELLDDVANLNDNIEDIKEVFGEVADRSVPNPINDNERHEFILLQSKSDSNKLEFIRGIQRYNEKKLKKYEISYNIIKREFNANPVQLYKQFKETIKEEYKLAKEFISSNKKLKNKLQLKREVEKIKIRGNKIELLYNCKLNDFLDKLNEIGNKRYEEFNEI